MAKGTGDFAHQQVMRQMIPQTKTTAANRGSATPSRDWNPATAPDGSDEQDCHE